MSEPSEAHRAERAALLGLIGAPGSPACQRAAELQHRGDRLDWQYLMPRLLAHELAARALEADGDALEAPPLDRDRLRAAAAAARQRARRCQFTLFRFLEVATQRGLEPMLLKGAALAGTLYPDPADRHMIDIDVLVAPAQVSLARDIAAELDLGLGRRKLPAFFHRLVHFEMLLQPLVDGLVPIDLHWRLHSPARLLTDDFERLWRRRRRASVYGLAVTRLDAADEWLHLATHLWGNWGRTPSVLGVEDLAALVDDTSGTVHIKWVRDLAVATEHLSAELSPGDLVERAGEWSAVQQTAATLVLVTPLLAPAAMEFARAVSGEFERGKRQPLVIVAAGRVCAPRPTGAAHPALGFRWRQLRGLGRWMFPPRAYLRTLASRRRGGSVGACSVVATGCVHSAAVVGRALLAGLALPVAFVGRGFAGRSRAAARRRARHPQRVFELVRAYSAFELVYARRFGGKGT